jgi:Tc toxin complex TcA C-terminal TcB-binding domain
MEGQIRTLYYQAYTLAYDLAKRAEKVFRFERGLTTSNFIQFGYWDAAYDGLLAGERLYIGLKQLEAADQEKRGYDFALIDLKEKGVCEFTLPEVLFDMDRPGDYMRRIKSVALTVPCVVGPYTSLNCTLRLLEHKFRTSSVMSGKGDYPEKTDETDERTLTIAR